MAQAIQSNSALHFPGEQVFERTTTLPVPALTSFAPGETTLLPGLYRERREMAKAYLSKLGLENVLQNHLLEAGVRIERPVEKMHQGWESPHSQLRGHFAGHWLSAVSRFASIDRDPVFTEKSRAAVRELQRCQELNHGQWVGSIPVKYFDLLSEKRAIWSPQYTVHKTMMGLLEAFRNTGDETALRVLENSASWFDAWSEALIKKGDGAVIYSGECAGMLELWTDLYAITRNEQYLHLAARYAMPDLFRKLLEGGDPLSNDHANASIPWIQGAARLYETTGDRRYREIVEAFWKQAVEVRGMFATTGNNAGEFWIPPHQFGRFLGSRTQEHCTVYNMIRVANSLLRWTGDIRYADYIERALYNGILAQQNPTTGMVAYFLPLQPGARKIWGSETSDFWCCHGTLVQAQAMFEDLIFYRVTDGLSIMQFIPSQVSFLASGSRVQVSLRNDDQKLIEDFSQRGEVSRAGLLISVVADQPTRWVLRVRQPSWAPTPGSITVDGVSVPTPVSKDGYLEINREWHRSEVRISFEKQIRREPLAGDSRRFALLDGPIVLAAVSSVEPELNASSVFIPRYEHQYIEGRDWQTSHYAVRGTSGLVELKPLYEVENEQYCVYFYDPNAPLDPTDVDSRASNNPLPSRVP